MCSLHEAKIYFQESSYTHSLASTYLPLLKEGYLTFKPSRTNFLPIISLTAKRGGKADQENNEEIK